MRYSLQNYLKNADNKFLLIIFQNFTAIPVIITVQSQNGVLDWYSGPCSEQSLLNELMALKYDADGKSIWRLQGNNPADMSLRHWYDSKKETCGPLPHIYDYYSDTLRRLRIQNYSGTKPGFFIGSASNYALQSPQVLDFIKKHGSDILVVRANANPAPHIAKLNYEVYLTPNVSAPTPMQVNVDYASTYSFLKGHMTNVDGKKIALLGYSFSTRGIDPVRGPEQEPLSRMVDSIFAKYHVINSATGGLSSGITEPNVLRPYEYITTDGINPFRNQVPSSDGTFLRNWDDHIFINYANIRATNKSIQRAQSVVSSNNLDGLAYDLTVFDPTHHTLTMRSVPTLQSQNANWLTNYKSGLRHKYLTESKSFFTFFNLLEPGNMTGANESRQEYGGGAYPPITQSQFRKSQEELLQFAHGGLLEYFGGRQEDRYLTNQGSDICSPITFFCKRAFSELIEQAESWRRNPEKYFMVYGRGPKTFISYDEEYNWQEYLYGVYLLGSGPNTSFKYASVFTYPLNSDTGRTDGLQIFDTQLIDLGTPKGRFHRYSNGLYWREFEKVLVLVNPHDASQNASTTAEALRSRMPITNGDYSLVKSSLRPGEIAIVTGFPRMDNVGRDINFIDSVRDLQNRRFFAQYETMKENDHSVRILESNPAYMNDILLNMVKYRNHQKDLLLRIHPNTGTRSTEKKIVLVAEVDDFRTINFESRRRFIAFELLPTELGTLKRTAVVEKPVFRGHMSTADTEHILLIRIPNAYENNKEGIQNIDLDPQMHIDVAHGHLKFRRWEMIRFHGDFNLYQIKIGTSNLIQGP